MFKRIRDGDIIQIYIEYKEFFDNEEEKLDIKTRKRLLGEIPILKGCFRLKNELWQWKQIGRKRKTC